jgi:hypothetical protein
VTSELGGYLALQDDADLAREVGYYVLRKMERVPFASLSHPERVIACLTELEMEVSNGGFDQYYWNSPGEHARAAVAALRELGAPHVAQHPAEPGLLHRLRIASSEEWTCE